MKRQTPLRRTGFKKKATHALRRSPLKKKARKAIVKGSRVVLSPAEYAKLREEIFVRDEGICQISGYRVSHSYFSLDHIEKCKMGGGSRRDVPENVRLASPLANQLREDGRSPEEIIKIMRAAGLGEPVKNVLTR